VRLIKTLSTLLLLCALLSCTPAPKDFAMSIEKVDELHGFVLKGLSVSGRIEQGCIANDDKLIITRGDKVVFEELARILNVADLPNPEAFNGTAAAGDYATFYLPDAKPGSVLPGDVLSSIKTSCKSTS